MKFINFSRGFLLLAVMPLSSMGRRLAEKEQGIGAVAIPNSSSNAVVYGADEDEDGMYAEDGIMEEDEYDLEGKYSEDHGQGAEVDKKYFIGEYPEENVEETNALEGDQEEMEEGEEEDPHRGRKLASRVFYYPRYGGRRVDWCREWGQNCGKPAADLFCRKAGYQYSNGYAGHSNMGGPTNVLGRYGQVCWAPYCDSFRYIRCYKPDPPKPKICGASRQLGPHAWGNEFRQTVCGYCPSGTTQKDWNIKVRHNGHGSCHSQGWTTTNPNNCQFNVLLIESGGMANGRCYWELEKRI